MICPSCKADDTKVVDSRLTDEGTAVRRRRRCESCGERCTTFERVDRAPLEVAKATGENEPFDRQKVIGGLTAAAKGRPVGEVELTNLAIRVEDMARLEGGVVTSSQIGLAVLDGLRELDEVAYLRFASVYKNFDAASDFANEVELLHKLGN